MLEYLVTSKVRRLLLSLVWGEKAEGTVAELADLAGVAFSGAHNELKSMLRAGVAVSNLKNGVEVFSANVAHPQAAELEALVRGAPSSAPPALPEDDAVRRKLVGLGAPLRGVKREDVDETERMSVLLQGASLARRDPTVARTLPICFWALRESLDAKALGELPSRAEDKHAVAFFMELAGELGGDRRLGGLAESLRDRRLTNVREFFQTAQRQPARAFPLAEKWGFRMNMEREAFQSLFEKFVKP